MAANEQQLDLTMSANDSMLQGLKSFWNGGNDQQAFDRLLLWCAIFLLSFGLIMVASSSMPVAERLTGNPFHFVFRHSFYLLVSGFMATVTLLVPTAIWDRHNLFLCVVAIVMLMAVLVIGHTVNGATRWLKVGPLTLQVAEFAKLFFFVFLASYLNRRHDEVRKNWRGFMKALLVMGIITFLILLQPDLGSVIVLTVTAMAMLFIAGARIPHFIALALTMLVLFIGLIIFEPYRMRRVTSFLDPWEDPFGSGYQLTQSLMAFGRGDVFGQGLGNSVQKLQFLPEAHTDFIMAVIGEELGFTGVVAVIALVLVLVLKALMLGQKALRQKKPFAGYLAHGIGIWFFFQAAVNVGASAGLIPTKGLTLPLVSYGGSSLMVTCIGVALLLRIDYEVRNGFKWKSAEGQA
ncbi:MULTISPECIES: putative lipid II flippase FtsW [Gammaproteobacteria]|uniref:putative lipid II flippase FtsW n=1 Tax=Gammaproteobacteria TaxID=1236 RepID=UPI000DD0E5EE|nr:MULTISPECIES: putative lipid II flippase FtsW [Gammaproteobacteria]RTE86318.1 putative lipid II flippase FtsW [Aliidiomarina sp. B3213]TCZ91668.1 putative lipid II flippase FtsW [Lysobacter sp. N42]